MSKFDLLWEYIRKTDKEQLTLTFDEIERIVGTEIDHSFLSYKKDLLQFGFEVKKISLKKRIINFEKTHKL